MFGRKVNVIWVGILETLPVCNYTLAVDRQFKSEGQPTADFIPVQVWRQTAEFVANYFTKGMRVFVVGRLQVRMYEDGEGNKRHATEVVANQVGFADGKKDGISNRGTANPDDFADENKEILDSDVPF